MPIPRAAKMFIAVFAAASVAAGGALGDDANPDAVRGAVERGEIKPLAEIIATLRDKLPGEIVGTEIERKKGRWLYEFRTVDRQGRLFEVYVNAANGEIERIKEK